MTTNNCSISIFFAFILFFSIGTFSACGDNANAKGISYKVFEIETNKWGYQIDVNGKAYIYQDIIPVVEGYKCFKTKDDAKKTAELMVEKMKEQGGGLPAITIEDIEALHLSSL